MEKKTIFDSRICKVELLDKQLISFNFKGNEDHKVEEFQVLIKELVILMNHQPFVVLNDLRNNFGGFSKEIRNFLGSHPDLIKYKYAEALIVNSLGIRLQVNFFLQFNVKKMKYKVFSDERKAIKWLLERREEILL